MMVTKVENFIGGNKELMEWFKRFVEYEGRDEVINNVPRNVNKVRLSVCRGLGPSYRLLPKLVSIYNVLFFILNFWRAWSCADFRRYRKQPSSVVGEMACAGKC